MNRISLLSLPLLLAVSCTAQQNDRPSTHDVQAAATPAPQRTQLNEYITRMHQDRAGNIWFGTNGDGICRYDGKALAFFGPKEGFGSMAVRGIAEAGDGEMWFATTDGVTRYDGRRFINYTTRDGLSHNQVWSILQDRKGTWWFGTEGGVSRYDGNTFTSFPLPPADLARYPAAYPAPKLVNAIFQDRIGDIWLGTNGRGVYRYDGKKLTQISEKDGLCNDVILSIMQDKRGNMWFGSGFGGASRYDGTTLTTMKGLSGTEVWTMREMRNGSIWFSTGNGVDMYDGTKLVNYAAKDGLANRFVQSMVEDSSGNLWFGTSGGLYRFRQGTFVNVTREDFR